jgi:hypothetical protein
MELAQLIPAIHNVWEFVFGLAFLCSQAWQFWVLHRIKKQTNGMVEASVASARQSGVAQGELVGAAREQARVAAKLALANEVESHLAELGRHE